MGEINVWSIVLRDRACYTEIEFITEGSDFMQIGETMRKYRKMRDMTQEEMANRLGVTPPAVNKWENGGSLR